MKRKPPVPVHLGSPHFTSMEYGPFLVTDAWFPPGLLLPPHTHDRTVLATTLEGTWDSVLTRRPRICTPFTVLTEPAGERHSNHFASGAHVLAVQPAPEWAGSLGHVSGFLDRINHFRAPAIAVLARRLQVELNVPDAISPLAIEALALELLVHACRFDERSTRPRHAPVWLARAIDFLRAHYKQNLSLAQIASSAGVHPAHLTRVFRQHQGMSVGAFVRTLRLEWAAAQLTACGEPIAVIATKAGFVDQSHFTRLFLRHTGRTPAQFRRSAGRGQR